MNIIADQNVKILVVTLGAPSENSDPEDEVEILAAQKSPQGSLTLMTPDGTAFGFINAEELTAFRTALASSLLMSRRSKVRTITVFGSGKQAYWHIRLALMLHGATLRMVHIHAYRFSETTKGLFKSKWFGFLGRGTSYESEY